MLPAVVIAVLVQTSGIAQSAPPFWDDIQAFRQRDKEMPPAAGGILFVGSSSFTRWTDVQDYFPGYPILNRGFGGSTLVDVIRYSYDVILPYKPRQVVIYCGENDIASSESVTAEEVTLRLKTLFAIIRQNLPDSRIDFVSMKPSPSRRNMQDRVKAANRQIRQFITRQKNAGYIDVYGAMLDTSGNMRPELYVEDQLHMKPEGYQIWKKIILPYLLK